MNHALIDYLNRQAVPRSLQDIALALKIKRIAVRRAIEQSTDNIERCQIDGIPHYFIPTEAITMTTTTTTTTIKPVPAYPAIDGTLFLTEQDAIAHNIGMDMAPRIEKYLQQKGLNAKAVGMQKSIILKWEIWRLQHGD